MKGTWKVVQADGSGLHQDDYTEHHVRRLQDGSWERKETERSHAAFVAREKRDWESVREDGLPRNETWEQYSDGWGWNEKPGWIPMEEEVGSPLSARYDVFVARWRGELSKG